MKYAIEYKNYHFLIDSDLPNNCESMQVVYKGILILKVEFLQSCCKVIYNTKSIIEREEEKLDEIFRSYRGDVFKIMPQVIEVLFGKYIPEFIRLKSVII